MTIRALVDLERRHSRRSEVVLGVLSACAVIAVVLTLGAATLGRARWLVLPPGLPLFVWAVIVGGGAALAVRTRRRLMRNGSHRDIAMAIEREQGMRRGLLVGALEIEGDGALADRVAAVARRTLPANAALAPALRRTNARRVMRGAGAAAAALLLLLTATPVFGDGLRAVFRPIDAWRGRLLETLTVQGAPTDLLRGAPLRVSVHAPGRRYVYLDIRQTGDAWRTDTLLVDTRTGNANWSMDALRGDVRLIASDGRSSSDSVVVHAADRPFVGALTLHAYYPGYLGRADESLPVGEPLHLPRGTVLSIAGRASVPLTDVVLLGEAGEHIALATVGQTFSGAFTPDHSLLLRWTARGPGGLVPDLPEPVVLDVVPDSAPHVVISMPLSDTVLVSGEPVALSLAVSDDHGVASVALRMVRGSAYDAAGTTQPVASSVGTNWAGSASVDVSSLGLSAGDAVRVRAEATDGSPWAQRGVSREIVLRRATNEEQRVAARALGDSAVKEAQAAVNAERSLAQRTDEAARSQARQGSAKQSAAAANPSQKNAMNFENAEKARSLSQEQRAMADRVQRLKQATRQLEQQLKAAGALDTALTRQLGEAQALLRQAMTPDMMSQMQKLESASKQMNAEQSRDAMRDLAQMQQKMREQLEKSAEILKRAAHEGAMQTLGDEAKELAEKERNLANSSRTPDQPKRSQDAAQLAARTERLREAMDELKSRLAKDKADAGANRTDEAGQHAAKSETEMRKAANQLKESGDKSPEQAQPGGQKESEAKTGADTKSGTKGRPGSEGKPGSDAKSGDPKQNGDGKPGRDAKAGGKSAAGAAQPQSGGSEGGAGKADGQDRAQAAAAEMDRAATSMQAARSEQVKEWKQELTSELDQSVQEMMQLAREERSLADKARTGAASDERRSAQSAVEQGVDKANERLQGAGKKSALLSPSSQRSVADAKEKVSQATQSVAQPGNDAKQAGALSEAADALTKAAASLARDRERANSAKSASGFSEMLQQMQEMAQKQGQINGQAQSLMNMPNSQGSAAGQSLARSLARQQRQLADQLDETGDAAGGERAAQLAREARQLADALDNGRLDGSTLVRQQQLFRRLLDAGKSLEKEERDDTGKREAKSATTNDAYSPAGKTDAKAAVRFQPPTWQELRALSADERRAILDYFTRLNSAGTP